MTLDPRQPHDSAGPTGKSLAELAAPFVEAPSAGLPAAAWAKVLVVGVLFVLVNLWQLEVLYFKWRTDANWSHGFLIPLFSLYLLYVRRQEIFSAPRRACLWGLAILVLGLLCSAVGVWPIRNQWFSHASLVLSLFGLVLYLAGPSVVRVAWVPVVYLILAMPLPDTLYDGIALPLQKLAAKSSEMILRLFGAKITVEALQLEIWSVTGQKHGLTVAEACSGIRSMMAFVALSVAWAYITDRPGWQRLVLVLAGIPITVACNILRVTLTATAFVVDWPVFGQDLMHEFMGMALLVPAAALLWLLSKFLENLFVDVEEEDEKKGEAPAGAASGGPHPPKGAPP